MMLAFFTVLFSLTVFITSSGNAVVTSPLGTYIQCNIIRFGHLGCKGCSILSKAEFSGVDSCKFAMFG